MGLFSAPALDAPDGFARWKKHALRAYRDGGLVVPPALNGVDAALKLAAQRLSGRHLLM